MTIAEYDLNDRYVKDHGTVFLTGIDALARLPAEQLRADRRRGHNTASFISGYQGSPLGGYGSAVERASAKHPDLPIEFSQGLNEEYAATAVMGSQLAAVQSDSLYDGVVGIWYGKAPGVDRAADAIRHATIAGTSILGGAVALVGDDPSAKSSTIASSSAGLLSDMYIPILYPGDPGEALDLGRHAIALSRATGMWSALKIVADVADATASIDLDPDRIQPIIPTIDGKPYEHSPNAHLLGPNALTMEKNLIEVRHALAREYATVNKLNAATVNPSDAWIGIVASGITYREVREALERLGLRTDDDIAAAGIRLFKMSMPMPFNPETIRTFSKGLEEVFVIEEKHGILERNIKEALYYHADRPNVVGKETIEGETLLPAWGALDADALVTPIRRRLEGKVGDRLVPEKRKRTKIPVAFSVARTPSYCSGCPHSKSTEVPAGSLVGAGVGCHTMSILGSHERIGEVVGLTAMGNEGTQWIGMANFVERSHLFQNLGDGTYFHSGGLAVTAAIASGKNITYKLLYNDTVAMTGGQNPEGQLSVPEVAEVLLTQGVARVIITTDDMAKESYQTLPKEIQVWDRRRLVEAQEVLAAIAGTTVLIHDEGCAAEVRRARKRGLVETPRHRVVINERICEGCGDCGQVSNCLSVQPVETEFGRKTKIDQTTCNLDYSCLNGDCPSFMTVTLPGEDDSTDEDAGRAKQVLNRTAAKAVSKLKERAQSRTPRQNALTGGVAFDPTNIGDDFPVPTRLVDEDDYAMRITGIGGTGVVTVSQVLGTAAMLDGYYVRGLDQIGLSQKAGPVVSDVRLSKTRAAHTNKIGEGHASLLLVFDQLVAASTKGTGTSNQDMTYVVGSTSSVPTAAMILEPSLPMPSAETLQETIAEHTKAGHHWADAQAIVTSLFGNSTTANIFVVGMAVQAGVLPIDPTTIERAIELNSVSVDANRSAFRWGRLQVNDPDKVVAACAHTAPETREAVEHFTARLDQLSVSGEQRKRLSRFAGELEQWGDAKTAHSWFDTLGIVADAERKHDGNSSALLDAVAAGLFKLTAYKDEYEVARLMLLQEGLEEANALAGDRGEVAWKLHPPMLRALGMENKITIGTWATPAIRKLAAGKRLRGTKVDPFGQVEVRRVERELTNEYRSAVLAALPSLSAETFPTILELAELPDIVRGFEDIKLANVKIYRERLAAITSTL